MIQRIQTIYMFLAVVFTVLCLCMQIGTFSTADVSLREYNLWLTDPVGMHHFTPWPLFAVLVLSASVGTCNIFLYMNRKMQARICSFNMLLILGWYILYAVFSQTLSSIVPGSVSLSLPLLLQLFLVLQVFSISWHVVPSSAMRNLSVPQTASGKLIHRLLLHACLLTQPRR